MSQKVFLITNVCANYTVKLFELLAQKIDVEYYFTGGEEAYSEKKIKVMKGNFNGEYLKGVFLLPKFRFNPKLFSILFKKYDMIIKTIDGRLSLPLTFLFAKLFRRPFIFWVGLWQHPQTLFHKVSYFFTKFIYKHSDAIVVYGEHIKRYFVGLGIDEGKIFCARHVVDNSRFNREVSLDEKNRTRRELKVRNEKILLYVGRLEHCKGIEYLIEAAANIHDVEKVIFFIGSGSQRSVFEEQYRKVNIQCRFLEFVSNDQLYRYYAIADIFVLPSISTRDFKEPWGLVINEAMNQGCPIIATDAVGAAAGGLVENEWNGLIVQEKNTEELRNALNRIFLDESLRLEMSTHSRKKIKNWTQENMVQGFIGAVEYVQQKGMKRESRKCHAQ